MMLSLSYLLEKLYQVIFEEQFPTLNHRITDSALAPPMARECLRVGWSITHSEY